MLAAAVVFMVVTRVFGVDLAARVTGIRPPPLTGHGRREGPCRICVPHHDDKRGPFELRRLVA